MFKTLRSRVIATYLVVVVISLVLASMVFGFFLARYVRDRERSNLRRQVTILAADIGRVGAALPTTTAPQQPTTAPRRRILRPRQTAPQAPATGDTTSTAGTPVLDNLLREEARVMKAQLFVVSSTGQVIVEAGSFAARANLNIPASMFSASGPRVGERYLARLQRSIMFASAPTTLGSQTCYLIAVQPVEETRSGMISLIWYLMFAGGIALVISMALALYLSGTISRPFKAIAEAARGMAAGDYDHRVDVKGSAESIELATDFNTMADRVQMSYELQRDFAANVSHELRTPLTSIEGFSQALLDGISQSEDERQRSLEIINQESKRLVRVLRDLLLLSQIDAGEFRPEKNYVDLVDTLRKMDSLYRGRAEDKRITLQVESPPSGLTVLTDPDRLERVLTNLLDNAMKYTGAGGTVVLSAAEESHTVNISVADNGPGIDPELLSRIFDRFYRVQSARSRGGGAGLGLAICKELVESLGGRIWVSSEPGRGTVFTVALPD